MKSYTSAVVTSNGSAATTVKNAFISDVTAFNVFGRNLAATTSKYRSITG